MICEQDIKRTHRQNYVILIHHRVVFCKKYVYMADLTRRIKLCLSFPSRCENCATAEISVRISAETGHRSLNVCIFMCFLNASKAFDRVKHSVLFSKLVRRGVPGYIVRLLCYGYDRQAVCIRWGNSLSDPFHVNNGVRQGGILSPYLFNVYMDDLSQSLNCCKTGCLSGEIMINHLMYADDLVLLSPSATGLRELLRTCEKYSKEHAIIYNSKKSSVLICKNRATMHVPSPSFAVNDTVIGEVAKVKYLGHVIANDMTDDADMMRQRRQLYALCNVLSRRFHMCSIEVKNTLFRSFCTPMYTCQLWWNFSVQSMHKLNVAYNNAFRFMHHHILQCKFDVCCK